MRLLADLLRGLATDLRATLPSTPDEGGAFLSGMVYSFLIHWGVLVAVTYAYCSARGGC
jgi:hypothetical protein